MQGQKDNQKMCEGKGKKRKEMESNITKENVTNNERKLYKKRKKERKRLGNEELKLN